MPQAGVCESELVHIRVKPLPNVHRGRRGTMARVGEAPGLDLDPEPASVLGGGTAAGAKQGK